MGPGQYAADKTEGITRVEDLPLPLVEQRSRRYRRRVCRRCGRSAYRHASGQRTLHDVGSLRRDRPLVLHVTYSKHRCESCGLCFNAPMDDLAPAGSHYTHRVISLALRLVVEDGLPYRLASWHRWRDHRVFVPFTTIQNSVEAAGKKNQHVG
jgi:hypothetical protein